MRGSVWEVSWLSLSGGTRRFLQELLAGRFVKFLQLRPHSGGSPQEVAENSQIALELAHRINMVHAAQVVYHGVK